MAVSQSGIPAILTTVQRNLPAKAPATNIVLIVEPSTVLDAQVKFASLDACEAEYLEALHLDMTSDMPWKDQAGRNHKKIRR